MVNGQLSFVPNASVLEFNQLPPSATRQLIGPVLRFVLELIEPLPKFPAGPLPRGGGKEETDRDSGQGADHRAGQETSRAAPVLEELIIVRHTTSHCHE